jgi:hypothetical protein
MEGQVLYWSGRTYDAHAAAAYVLEAWAAVAQRRYDVTLDGQGLKREQLYQHLMETARMHWARSYGGPGSASVGGGASSVPMAADPWRPTGDPFRRFSVGSADDQYGETEFEEIEFDEEPDPLDPDLPGDPPPDDP